MSSNTQEALAKFDVEFAKIVKAHKISRRDARLLQEAYRRHNIFPGSFPGLGTPSEYKNSKYFQRTKGYPLEKGVKNWWGLTQVGEEIIQEMTSRIPWEDGLAEALFTHPFPPPPSKPNDDCHCPKCGAEDDEISWDGDRQFGSGEASQEAQCNNCGCHWVTVYKFSHNQIIEE